MIHKTVIWGASGHARVVADAMRLAGEYEIVGFIDDVNPERTRTRFCGLPVIGSRERVANLLREDVTHVIFAFGNCAARLRLTEWARSQGFSLAVAIHPHAVIAKDVLVGAGTTIAAGVVVNSGAKIGENVILNTSCSVDHDTIVEDGAHICPGVHLAGNVIVEKGAWVGIGATVIERVRIGAWAMIGAGAVVVKDVPEGVMAYGVPAEIIKKVDKNGN